MLQLDRGLDPEHCRGESCLRIRHILVLLVLLVALTSCKAPPEWGRSIEGPKEYGLGTYVREFCFDAPKAVQAARQHDVKFQSALAREDRHPDRFSPSLDGCGVAPNSTETSQADFIFVIESVTGISFNDTLVRASQYVIRFDVDCRQASLGPQVLRYWYYEDQGRDEEYFYYYATESFDVDLQRGILGWSQSRTKATYEHSWWHRDPGQRPIGADDALRLAESAGGADFRADVSDQCAIGGWLGKDNREWEVTYYSKRDERKRLVMLFDAVTGARK